MPNQQEKISITYASSRLKSKAESIAEKWQFPLVDNENPAKDSIQLRVNENNLELICHSPLYSEPLLIDFLNGKNNVRRIKMSARKELLAVAMGLHRQKNKTICDLTAGWGQDAFVMACLGAKVIMIERSPVVAALLQDAWQRACQVESIQKLSWQFLNMDSFEYLQELEIKNYPQVIYLDPMFPERKKSALVKKEMQILQKIIGEENDSAKLLNSALRKAKERVVVKRPRLAEPLLPEIKRDLILFGKNTRFDIYFIKRSE